LPRLCPNAHILPDFDKLFPYGYIRKSFGFGAIYGHLGIIGARFGQFYLIHYFIAITRGGKKTTPLKYKTRHFIGYINHIILSINK